jgi:alanyl-tRNA synthetase
VDLTEEIARDEGFRIDKKGFEDAMEAQRARARESWKGSGEEVLKEAYKTLVGQNLKTEFIGYDRLEAEGQLLKILKGDAETEVARENEEVEIIVDRTPFYGESGGQEGDCGTITHNGSWMEVSDSLRPLPEVIVHRGKIKAGVLRVGDKLHLKVDPDSRGRTTLNHTATHLLQSALRQVLGGHVHQAGSLVTPARLRFDYTHFSPLTDEEIDRVEEIVNSTIRHNLEVCVSLLPYKEALARGAMALFGEKYGEVVRLVQVGGMSAELCGGTHTRRSGDIGTFKIVSETGVAAGVRRIEALSGEEAWRVIKREEAELRAIAAAVKAKTGEVAEKVQRLIREQKETEKAFRALQARMSTGQSNELIASIRSIRGIQVLSTRVEIKDPKGLREMADRLKNQIRSGIVLLGSQTDGKVMLICAVTPDLAEKYPAQKLVKEIAQYVGGTGGGRADMAQAGGTNVEGLNQALEKIYEII